MSVHRFLEKTGRGFAVAAVILAAIGLTTASRPAYAVSPGAAAGIGLGAFTAGVLLANPYNRPYYYYPYGYYGYYPPAPAYYPSPYYPPVRRCWDPYYGRYYSC
jgi:hypothetical protein